MDITNVPQDKSSTYANNKKAIYARDHDGKVKVIGSSGWEAEEITTLQALNDLQEMAEEAYCEVKKGKKSPLFYHMYAIRMDLQLMSDATGFFKWTIKRDFKPDMFSKIDRKRVSIYSEVMGIAQEELKILPEMNYACE